MSVESGKLILKTNFSIKHKWEPFYTGGAVATCDDGKTLLCSRGDLVQAIDVATGEIKHSLNQEGDPVTSVIASPDNEIVVSATRSLLFKQWKLGETADCVRTWKAIHTGPVSCMDFDPTSTLLASGSSDSTIKVWDMVRQYCTHNLRGSSGVISVVKFHPRELKIFSASDDYLIRVWDLHTSRCIATLKSHVSAITSLAFVPSDSAQMSLVSGGRDSVLCVWDMDKLEENASLGPKRTFPVFETIEAVLPVPTDHVAKLMPETDTANLAPLVITAGNNGQLRIWSTMTGKCVYKEGDSEGVAESSEASEDKSHPAIVHLLPLQSTGKYASVTYDHNINIYDIDRGFVLDKHLVGYNDEILDVRFFGASDSHIIVATNSPMIKVFDLMSSACQLLEGHKDSVLSLDVFKDAMTFASGSKDNTVRIWKMDPASHKVRCVAIGQSHTHAAATVACSRLKKQFLISGSQDQTFKIWNCWEDVDDGKPVTLKVKHTVKAHDKDINSVTISPNDKFVATGSQDKTAKLWSIEDGSQLGTFRGHKRGIWSVQFSPTDQVLCSSSADGTLKLWALSNHSCLKTLEGHDCLVLKVIFISKGTQIMSSGSDGLLKLWNVKSSECVQTFDGHDDKVWGLAVNAEDNLVLSGAADSKIIQWEDVTLKEKEEERLSTEAVILRQQELNNLIHEKKFSKALRLAITLDQPFTALKVVKEIRWQDSGKSILEDTVTRLRPDQKDALLKFLMSWNTNSRNCHEAQNVLSVIVKSVHPRDLLTYSNAQAAVEALLPYTERHFQRISKVLEQTTFVNYIWQMMKLKPVSLSTNEPTESTGISNNPASEIVLKKWLPEQQSEAGIDDDDAKSDGHDVTSSETVAELQEDQHQDETPPKKRMKLRSSNMKSLMSKQRSNAAAVS